MPIQTGCPGCGKLLAVADEFAGRKARCPACGTIYTVPSQASAVQAASAEINPVQAHFPNSGPSQAESGPILQHDASPASPHEFSEPEEKFWMRTTDGSIYGPTNRDNLNRWFREGRVGNGYQIRFGESGDWQDASLYSPAALPVGGLVAAASGNPYAAQGAAGTGVSGTPLHKYPKPDRGVVILIMGILSFVICFFFGIVAIVMGRSALNDISAGLANPNDKPLVQVGFWLGVASLILNIAVIGFAILMIALSAANQL